MFPPTHTPRSPAQPCERRTPTRSVSRLAVGRSTLARLALGWLALATCPGLAACSDDIKKAGPADASATATDGTSATSFVGVACASNNDCVTYGLTCYVTNSAAGTGICSRGCKTETDCGGGLAHCNSVQGELICTLPRYCDPCTTEQDCGASAPTCVKDTAGNGFCSNTCTVNQDACAPGALCRKFGPKVDEFACMPAGGTCSGDGGQCSPCKTDGDCSPDHACFQADANGERFCSRGCNPAASGNSGCEEGYQCVKYGEKGVCYKVIDGKPRPSCSAGTKGFCDPCTDDWQCASNRCATKNDKRFCVQPTPCNKDKEGEDCPLGGVATFCVPSSSGNICAPPPAFNCHGYMACFSHPCGPSEQCVNGICKKD